MERDSEAFRAFLTNWLETSGWSQFQLAMATGIGQSLISRWLSLDPRRRTRPTIETLQRLAPVVGRSSDDLLRLAGYLSEESDPDAGLPAELAALMHDLEAGWRAADASHRVLGARVVRAAFHIPRVQPQDNRRKSRTNASTNKTANDTGLDNPKVDSINHPVHA